MLADSLIHCNREISDAARPHNAISTSMSIQPKVGGFPFLPSESAKMCAIRKSHVRVVVRGRRPVVSRRTSGNPQELMSVNWSGRVTQPVHRQFGAMSCHFPRHFS